MLIKDFPKVEFGAHLHSTFETAVEKVEAAVNAGCKRFDGAIKGFGGCPMAKDDLVGNMPTEIMLAYLESIQKSPVLDMKAFKLAEKLSSKVFPH